jgi:aryl-alcohol dehydrogenase-like predicted oxidoreductase
MLMNDERVLEVARSKGISVIQLLLAWVLRQPDMVAIPKAVGLDHIEENVAASNIVLTDEELALLDESFPAPTCKVPMETR